MRRHGFTLVELLVVIGVITILVALLLPAVQAARESARLTSCRNNLRQIGLALSNYESVNHLLPSSSTSNIQYGVWSPEPTQYPLHSWASMLLPYVEQTTLLNELNFGVSALDPVNLPAASTVLSIYRCPSYSGSAYSQSPLYLGLPTTTTALATTSNSGMTSTPVVLPNPPLPKNYAIRNYATSGATTIGKLYLNPDGIMYACSSTRFSDVRDGLSQTIFIMETREPNAAVWIDGGTAALAAQPYNADNPPDDNIPVVGLNFTPYYTPVPNSGNGINCQWGPSSQHPGGVNHLFGDGSVHVLSPTINFTIYNALVTIAGSEVVEKNDY